MDYGKLSNLELIHCIARDNGNEGSWFEFYKRFHKSICTVIVKVCKLRDFEEGIRYPEDIAQDIYRTLVKNNCHALNSFKGEHESSIYKFLETISIRVILKKITESNAQKRIPTDIQVALDTPIKSQTESLKLRIVDIIPNGLEITDSYDIFEEIKFCIKRASRKRKQKLLYALIFEYYLFDDLNPISIAEKTNIDRSWKRVENIISEMKKDVRTCIQQRLNL